MTRIEIVHAPRALESSVLQVLRCPACAGHLEAVDQSDSYTCASCVREFGYKEGVLWLADMDAHYHPDIPKHVMREMLSGASPEELRRRFAGMLRELPESRRFFISENALFGGRAAGQLLVELGSQDRVLDLGCGWGNLAIEASYSAGQVIAMDLAPLRARFAQLRAESLGIQNLTVLGGGDTAKLPFAAGSFDLIVLNGVWEWVAASGTGHPDRRLVQYIREVHRVLSDRGAVLIGIENRFSAKYMTGMLEEHASLRYISLLPRWLADRYSERERAMPYRVRTYGYDGIRAILKKAGYADVKLVLPLPEYRHPYRIASFSSKLAMRDVLVSRQWNRSRRLAISAAVSTGIAKRLAHSFIVVARPRGSYKEVPLARRTIDEIRADAPELASRLDPASMIIEVSTSGSHRMVLLDKTSGARLVSARVGSGYRGRLVKAEVSAVDRLSRSDAPALVRDALPQRRAAFAWGGREVGAWNWMPGRSLFDELVEDAGDESLNDALRWITALHRWSVAWVDIEQSHLATWVHEPWRSINRLLPLTEVQRHEIDSRLGVFEDLLGRSMPTVFAHGDYEFRNFLRLPGGSLAILDWELARAQAPAAGDVIHLLVSEVANRRGDSYGAAARALFLESGITAQRASRALQPYLQTLDVPESYVPVLVALTALQDAAQWARRTQHDLASGWWDAHLLFLADALDHVVPNAVQHTLSPKEGRPVAE